MITSDQVTSILCQPDTQNFVHSIFKSLIFLYNIVDTNKSRRKSHGQDRRKLRHL